MPETTGAVSYAISDSIATVTLVQRSLSTAVRVELLAALRAAAADDQVRAVLLTGTGTVFSMGQDLAEHQAALAADPSTAFASMPDEYNPIITTLTEMAKPVIAVINGTCAGGGLGLALACDIRIAASTARFTTAFTGIGLVPDCGVSATLAEAVGSARASTLVLLAELFTAGQALEWGLLSQTVELTELIATATAIGRRFADGPAAAFAESKRLLREGRHRPLRDSLAAEYETQAQVGQRPEHRAAVEAFLTRRPAKPGR
jgi:2-(1,2-epoxy-1,2-dihydrophenyl)acetyl-CoA isomerase